MKRLLAVCALALTLPLGGCALGLVNPFQSGKFDVSVWRADLAAVKVAAKGTVDDVRAVMADLCPITGQVLVTANDPTNQALASTVVSTSAVQKNVNNVNSAVRLLDAACRAGDVVSVRFVLVAAAQTINDARAIFGR